MVFTSSKDNLILVEKHEINKHLLKQLRNREKPKNGLPKYSQVQMHIIPSFDPTKEEPAAREFITNPRNSKITKAMRHASSSSFPTAVLGAAAVLLLIGQVATATDLCAEANYKPLCQSLVIYSTDAESATASVLDNLIRQTNHGRIFAGGLGIGGDKIAQGCSENYVDALGKLQESLKYLKARDQGGFGTAISGAIAAYSICEDTYAEFGLISPLDKINMLMSHTADTCLTLYNQIH